MRLGHTTPQQHCSVSVVSLKAAWCALGRLLGRGERNEKLCFVCAVQLCSVATEIFVSQCLLFSSVLLVPLVKKTILCQELFLKILKIVQNF